MFEKTEIPTSALNPLGQVFEHQFVQACDAFEAERFEQANTISRRLLNEALIGNLHKAGCHLILAHSPDNYVYHAEQAVILFRGLYADTDPPSAEQKRSQDELIAIAEEVFERARSDAKTYAQTSWMSTPAKTQSPKTDLPVLMQRLGTDRLRSILASRNQDGA